MRQSRTWWGRRFITALEEFCDPARLSRGRAYLRNGRILSFVIADGRVTATVRGSVNPYFGTYTEPHYNTGLSLTPIPSQDWERIIARLASQASTVTRLLMNEVPEDIEASFVSCQTLLPEREQDFKTDCSCPDYENPCKHVAGVLYRLAAELDHNPLLLFELRGLSRAELHNQLRRDPLGQSLAAGLEEQSPVPELSAAYYTSPQLQTRPETSLKEFWQGSKRLPQDLTAPEPTAIPALLLKTEGDYPAFWERENSFLAAMEGIYERVRTKNQSVL
ncbi:SWIM zinc finger family protein [Candidatus Cyanaurora vandensis]|uniref:SWIM zinc finger family protein n=1 Tax=Candidatus Cyanaurora vandensis TaxID=2714958 RepID=UPI002580E14C|nr:SWIM zinc finger family protein [Candidatus Cyanaurora vandensis]